MWRYCASRNQRDIRQVLLSEIWSMSFRLLHRENQAKSGLRRKGHAQRLIRVLTQDKVTYKTQARVQLFSGKILVKPVVEYKNFLGKRTLSDLPLIANKAGSLASQTVILPALQCSFARQLRFHQSHIVYVKLH